MEANFKLKRPANLFSACPSTQASTMSGKGAKGLSGKGAKGTLGGKAIDKDKKKPISRSARAGLQFPVGRIHRLLKVRALRQPRALPAALTQAIAPVFADPTPRARVPGRNNTDRWVGCPQNRVTSSGRVGATAAVYSAAILGAQPRKFKLTPVACGYGALCASSAAQACSQQPSPQPRPRRSRKGAVRPAWDPLKAVTLMLPPTCSGASCVHS